MSGTGGIVSDKPCFSRRLFLSFGHPSQQQQLRDSCAGPAVCPARVGAEGQQAQTEAVLKALRHSSEDLLGQGWLGTH